MNYQEDYLKLLEERTKKIKRYERLAAFFITVWVASIIGQIILLIIQ